MNEKRKERGKVEMTQIQYSSRKFFYKNKDFKFRLPSDLCVCMCSCVYVFKCMNVHVTYGCIYVRRPVVSGDCFPQLLFTVLPPKPGAH